jgi:hypothetical protein
MYPDGSSVFETVPSDDKNLNEVTILKEKGRRT